MFRMTAILTLSVAILKPALALDASLILSTDENAGHLLEQTTLDGIRVSDELISKRFDNNFSVGPSLVTNVGDIANAPSKGGSDIAREADKSIMLEVLSEKMLGVKSVVDNTGFTAKPNMQEDGSPMLDRTPNLTLRDVLLKTGQTTLFDRSGTAPQFGVDAVLLAKNYIRVQGSTKGKGPVLRAAGTDVNIDLNFATIGKGGHWFGGGQGIFAAIESDGSDFASTDYLKISPGSLRASTVPSLVSTANATIGAATGKYVNVTIGNVVAAQFANIQSEAPNCVPQFRGGAGSLAQFGTFNPSGAEKCGFYFGMRGSGSSFFANGSGNILAVQGSGIAANYMTITNAATGVAPTVGCSGEAGCSVRLAASGTGTVQIGSPIRTVGALPVLGSCGTDPAFLTGATATAGTISVGRGGTTTCSISFPPNTFSVRPTCTHSFSFPLTVSSFAVTPVGMTWTFSVAVSDGQLDYICISHG